MAFENGYNRIDYSRGIFQKYQKDRLIFVKSLQILQYFQQQPEYPYCIDQIDNAIKNILGSTISGLADSERYIVGFDEHMKWDLRNAIKDYEDESDQEHTEDLLAEYDKDEGDKLQENFINEITSFCYTTQSLLWDIFNMNSNISSLKKIAVQEYGGDANRIIRFIRGDNEFLDFSIDDKELEKLCKSLLELKKENE